MADSAKIMAAAGFFDVLRSGTIPAGAECRSPVAATEDGRPITLPVKLLRRPGGALQKRPLLVVFHGAVDQEKRGFPYYEGGYALEALAETDAIVLSIADPSLWLSAELRAAWYAANRYADVPAGDPRVHPGRDRHPEPDPADLHRQLDGGARRACPVGPLRGLRLRRLQPNRADSGYYSRTVERYLSTCWGPEASVRPRGGDYTLPAGALDDCGTLYGDGHGHALILVQNATDPHLLRQAVPFVAQHP